MGIEQILHGRVEKVRQRCSRPFVMLTYSPVRSARPIMVAPFGMHQAMRGLAGRDFLNPPTLLSIAQQ